jgi:creatinine amidohydrolase
MRTTRQKGIRTWKWEELTAPDFARAVRMAQRTCLIPFGVLEKHGEHLPLGTDDLCVRRLAERAVAREPAIVFPPFYFGQIHEAKQFPGTLAIRHDLMFALLENVCEEIARNGMNKIILLNGHGGNELLVQYFTMSRLEKKRDYTLFTIRLGDYMMPVLNDPEWKKMTVTPFDYHGGEMETSLALAVRPDLVKRAAIPPRGAQSRKRLSHLPPVMAAAWWYADWPEHYAGDARPATVQKGEFLLDRFADRVAAVIKAVKADRRVAPLEAEYFARIRH